MLDNRQTKPITILLVDDNEMSTLLFRDTFWLHGDDDEYHVVNTKTVEEAERMLAEDECPDVVFLEPMTGRLQKHGVNRLDASEKLITYIRNDSRLHNTKIVVFTDNRDPEFKDHMLELGANYVVVKGVLMPKEIVQLTKTLYERHH